MDVEKKAQSLAFWINYVDQLALSERGPPTIRISDKCCDRFENDSANKRISACYDFKKDEYLIFQPALGGICDTYESQLRLAVHEVRHCLQGLMKQEISFSFFKKFIKSPLLFVLAMPYTIRRTVRMLRKKRDLYPNWEYQRIEIDVFFVEALLYREVNKREWGIEIPSDRLAKIITF